jgi:murein L,D-transpeptidase YcbB/YkuD
MLVVIASGCGGSGPSHAAVAGGIKARVRSLNTTVAIHGEQLIAPEAVARLYQARDSKPLWTDANDAEQIVSAIKSLEQDGLTPADYHLATIEAMLQERESAKTVDLEAELDLLLSDAVAGMLDHVRYGRVRPVSLDPKWNVDPREGASPLEEEVARIAATNSVTAAIDRAKSNHFIYRGLVGALAQLREIEAKGGWPAVPGGKSIPPGGSDPRVPAIRARLAVTGELGGGGESKAVVYDRNLQRAVETFQARHRIDAKAVIDKATIEAMNVSAGDRVSQIRVNLERARWVLGGLQDDFVLVNLPAFKAYLIRGGKNIWEARTQIGDEAKQTPTFRADMRTVVFNPDWTVPPMIIADEVVKGMQKSKTYLAEKKLVMFDKDNQEVDPGSIRWGSDTAENFPYTLRQLPGEGNALGRVKFLFPNKHSIYLHDTPSKQLFESDRRTFSHGCIRIENPLDLARVLLEGQDSWTSTKIENVLQTGKTENVELEHPIPVLIVYWTVSVGATGEIRFMDDIYSLDPPALAALNAPPRRQ